MFLTWITLCLSGFGQAAGCIMDHVSLNNLLTATRGDAVGFDSRDLGFARIETDSRTVRPGDLFWALQGEHHDGHDYVGEAVRRGAAACVVQWDKTLKVPGPRMIVRNTLEALWDAARWYGTTQEALIVGVTGSVGKTTTREMIHAALSAGFTGTRSPRNFNNHFGLPLSILEIEQDHEFAILELGASRVGEIRDLARVAAPEVGIVTAVGLAHFEKFGGEQQILDAKGELIEALPKSGFAVLPGDDPRTRSLAGRADCPVVFFGEGPENDLQATDVEIGPNRIAFRADGTFWEVPATGRHHLGAALAAIAIAREIGMKTDMIAEGLKSFVAAAGRCRLEQIGPWTVIDDTYNASPCSMRAACETLQNWKGSGKKLLVVGDMLELGERTIDCHLDLGRRVAAVGVHYLVAYGEWGTYVIRGAHEAGMDAHRLADCQSFEVLPAVLDCWLEPGDIMLVKGSRGMQMERVVEWLRQRVKHNGEENISRVPTRACA